MTAEMGILFSACFVFLIAGIILKYSKDTGRMVLIEHLKEDWSYRLPFHLKHNRYHGLSRPCFQLFVILFYIVKAFILISFCGFCCILAGMLLAIKWLLRTLSSPKEHTDFAPPAIGPKEPPEEKN